MVEYLYRMGYSDPLRGLAEVWSRPAAVLAAELGCTVYEAFHMQLDAKKAALPYFHQKQPLAVSVEEDQRLTVVTVDVGEMLGLLKQLPDNSPMRNKGLEVLAPLLDQIDAAPPADDDA